MWLSLAARLMRLISSESTCKLFSRYALIMASDCWYVTCQQLITNQVIVSAVTGPTFHSQKG